MVEINMGIDENGFLSQKITNNRDNVKKVCGDLFDLIYELNKTTYLLYNENKGNKIDSIGTYNLLFLNKIHKCYQSAVILIESGLEEQSNSITRILLENLFVMQAIHNDKSNYNKLIDKHYWSKNRTLSAINKKDELKNLRDSATNVIIDEKGKDTTIEMWAKEADMSYYYQNIYRVLSYDVHIELTKLEEDLNINDHKKTFKIDLSPKYNDIYILGCCLVDLMSRANNIFCNYFNINKYNEELQNIIKKNELLYNNYEKEEINMNKTN